MPLICFLNLRVGAFFILSRIFIGCFAALVSATDDRGVVVGVD